MQHKKGPVTNVWIGISQQVLVQMGVHVAVLCETNHPTSAAAGVLEDEHYDHGDDGEETYEHLGPILVGAEMGG